MSESTIYLVTGANRGIGLALVEHLLQRPDTTVIAAFRASSATAPNPFSAIEPPNASSTLIPLPLPTVPIPSPSALASLLPPSITRLDVVVANAGGTSGFRDVASTSAEDMRYDFEANAVGPAELFRCVWPLLERGATVRKFVLVSSSVGSIGTLAEENMPATAYGMSKAAANWWARKASLDFAERGLAVGILHPGWVKTGMGQGLADALGIEEAEPRMTASDSAKALLVQIDNLTLANSGEFKSYDGTPLPW